MENSIFMIAAALDVAVGEHTRIANNISNSHTHGFKEILRSVDGTYFPERKNTEKSLFPQNVIQSSWKQGVLEHTENIWDIGLQGDGFIVVEKDQDRRYWRSGAFHIALDGHLCTSQGFRILGEEGYIRFPPGEDVALQIDQHGNIFVNQEQVDTIRLVKFEDPHALVSYDGLYANPKGLQEIRTMDCLVHQGTLEKSTVDPIVSTIELISNTRYMESMQKTLHILDQGWQKLIEV